MASKKYEYNFLFEPSDKLRCLICFDIACDPKQHEKCGKIFCSSCIEKNKKKPCPSCRRESPNYFTDTRGAQEIRDIRVKCCNLKRGCNWQGTIGTQDKHLETCEFEYISCKYQYVGCDVKMMRKDIIKHEEEDDKKHLHLALQSVAIPTLSDSESLVIKMTDYNSKKQNKEIFFSDPFYTHANGYKMRAEIHACGVGSGEGSHLSMFLRVLKGPFDKHLQWPLSARASVAVLNQRGDYNHYNVELNENKAIQPGESWYNETFISHSLLSEDQPKKALLLQNTIYISVSLTLNECTNWLVCGKKIDPVLDYTRYVVVSDKPLVFSLPWYSDVKQSKQFFQSSMFFTNRRGYKMRIWVSANGVNEGEGTHVSVGAVILEGPYDKSLSWPFIGKIKVELLNQLADDNHFWKEMAITTKDNMNAGVYIGNPLIEHTSLESSDKYLQNDTLYFRVSVVEENHKPWLTCSVCD